jgi:hypothetical protein
LQYACIILVGKKSFDKSPILQIGTANISCDEVVKLLGVDIDFMLNFNYISRIDGHQLHQYQQDKHLSSIISAHRNQGH